MRRASVSRGPRRLNSGALRALVALSLIFCPRSWCIFFVSPPAQFRVVAACMDPLVEYGTALVIGTSPCRQKGEGAEGIYAADAHAAAAAAAAAAAGSYRT